MSQDNVHDGLPVKGYLPQTDTKVDLVNRNKEIEERCSGSAMNCRVWKAWIGGSFRLLSRISRKASCASTGRYSSLPG